MLTARAWSLVSTGLLAVSFHELAWAQQLDNPTLLRLPVPPGCQSQVSETGEAGAVFCEYTDVALGLPADFFDGCANVRFTCTAPGDLSCYLFPNATEATRWGIYSYYYSPESKGATTLGGCLETSFCTIPYAPEGANAIYLQTKRQATGGKARNVSISAECLERSASNPSPGLDSGDDVAAAPSTQLRLPASPGCRRVGNTSSAVGGVFCNFTNVGLGLYETSLRGCASVRFTCLSPGGDVSSYLFASGSDAAQGASQYYTPENRGVSPLGGCTKAAVCSFPYEPSLDNEGAVYLQSVRQGSDGYNITITAECLPLAEARVPSPAPAEPLDPSGPSPTPVPPPPVMTGSGPPAPPGSQPQDTSPPPPPVGTRPGGEESGPADTTLSAGAIAGIVVGSVACVLVVGFLAVTFARRGRKDAEGRNWAGKLGWPHKPPSHSSWPLELPGGGFPPGGPVSCDNLKLPLQPDSGSVYTGPDNSCDDFDGTLSACFPEWSGATTIIPAEKGFGAVKGGRPRVSDGYAPWFSRDVLQNVPDDEPDLSDIDPAWAVPVSCIRVYADENGVPYSIGEGGFGSVFLGLINSSQPTAIKVVLGGGQGQQARLVREVFHLSRCRHPNVISFYGYSFLGARLLLLMEFASGGSLLDALNKQRGPVRGWHEWAGNVAKDIASGLIYLHSIGIAHLDIKSPNILFERGMARIADVGLGKVVRPGANPIATNAGTSLWAAPEQLLGGECGFASDMWAFGTVLWELCAGHHPHTRPVPPLPPSAAPPAILRLIDSCHQTDPTARPTASAAYDIIRKSLQA